MAMVISTRAKAIIGVFTCFFLLGIIVVAGSTQGWFVPQGYYGERVAARIQGVKNKVSLYCNNHLTLTDHPIYPFMKKRLLCHTLSSTL